MSNDAFFKNPAKGGGSISGVKGGNTHFHDYNNLGIGHIKIQSTGKKIPVNNFNDTIDSLLPPSMK